MNYHWLVWLFFGGFVIGISYYLEVIAGIRWLGYLVFLGYALIAVSVFSFIKAFVTSPASSNEKKDIESADRATQNKKERAQFYPCPACRTMNHISNNYCRRCGVRLRVG